MTESEEPIGNVIRGDHRVLAVFRGFLGIVYICRQELPGKRYIYKAIKTFRRASDAVARRLFDRELAYWVALPPHPNVVQAKDADTVNKQLVLEFVPGPDLHSVAKHGGLHPRHFLAWARDIGQGLQFLHENQFIHRDLRPANILVDTQHGLRAKISDLGIGKPLDPEVSNHTVIGTFRYMAPEVHAGRTDFRSDIFSFGATLYFLLTGREAVRLTTAKLGELVSPSEVAPGIPTQLGEIVLRCLAREPEDRYPSMAEVNEALEAIEEWPIEPSDYEHCPEHDFQFYAERRDTPCPFCHYRQDFRRRQEYLARLLQKSESEKKGH